MLIKNSSVALSPTSFNELFKR